MQSQHGKLYLSGAFSLAGTSVITGYLLSAKLPAFLIMLISMGIVIVCLLPLYAGRAIQTIRRLSKHDWVMLFLQALFGIFLFRLFLLFGVTLTSTAEAGLLTGATPAITALLAYFILHERLSGTTVLGICATMGGVILLQGNNLYAVRFSSDHLWGNLLVLCAASSESIFNILSRKHRAGNGNHAPSPIHPMVQTLLVCAFVFFLSIVPACLAHPFSGLRQLGIVEWLALLWYGLVVTAVAFGCFYAGAVRCNAYTIAAFSGIMPLTAVLLSVIVLREQTRVLHWLGAALIILGILFIGQKNRRVSC